MTQMTKEHDPMLTREQAAEMLNIKAQTLDTWRSTRRQPQPAFVRVGTRTVRYRRSDIEAYIRAQTIGEAASK